MVYVIIVLVCFLSSAAGAVCGIGGGVIIKPVLDATGIMPVPAISFLSGCTVLSMSIVSMYKNLKAKRDFKFDKALSLIIAAGGVAGGLLGKNLYQGVLSKMDDTSHVGMIQAIVLLFITLGTFLYTLKKGAIKTQHFKNKAVIFFVGAALGVMSSFLGIGGGPINLTVLFYLFSMASKEAAMYSICIIMFSQIANLASTVCTGCVPAFSLPTLVIMVLCGVSGGFAGSKINKRISDRGVDNLFMWLMAAIIIVNVYNIFKYA